MTARWITADVFDGLATLTGTEWCGNTTPPMSHYTFRRNRKGMEEIYSVSNDGFDLSIRTSDVWEWHTDRQGANALFWFILRWRLGEWFGLRRRIWYWLLHRKVARNKGAL